MKTQKARTVSDRQNSLKPIWWGETPSSPTALDITMPVMDGITMLTKLKSDPALRPIPVFMLTAESGRECLLKVAKIGVRDYLVKPFKEDLLVEKVGRAVTLSRQLSTGTNTTATLTS